MIALVLGWVVGCAHTPPATPPAEDPPPPEVVAPGPAWPNPGAIVRALPAPAPVDGAPRVRLLVDPGHGAEGNTGNQSCLGELEQDVTLRHAQRLVAALERTERFELRTTRQPGELVDYPSRVVAADSWPADVFISLHTDARAGDGVVVAGPHLCITGAHGFSVLWSDEVPDDATPTLAADRLFLARRIATELLAAGFPAYDGSSYGDLYAADAVVPGVFVDRHSPSQRIRVLRRPHVPSVIIETHHAKDPEEPLRWEEDATHAAFAAALVRALSPSPPP